MLKKSIIIIITVVVLGAGVYAYFNSGTTTSPDAGLTTDMSANQVSSIKEAQGILQTLNKIKNLSIDDSIFTSSVFRSLQASQASTTPWTAGRSNPFAPLSYLARPVSATTIVQPTPAARPVVRSTSTRSQSTTLFP